MTRLSDLPESEQRLHLSKIRELPDFGPTPFVSGPPLDRRRVAIVTTSGMHGRGDRPFEAGSADYRIIPSDTPHSELLMSHISVNFDAAASRKTSTSSFQSRSCASCTPRGSLGRSPIFITRSWAPCPSVR